MRVLVTGHRGRIGSRLKLKGHEVRGVDIADIGDILETGFLYQQRMYKPEVIYHLAGAASVPGSIKEPYQDADVNIMGTLKVLEIARELKAKVIFAASAGTMYSVKSPYGLSKKTAAEYVALYNILYGVEAVTLGMGNVYGPGMGGVVGQMIEDEKHSRPGTMNPRGVLLNGGGVETRDFIYIDDVVRAFEEAIDWEPGYYEVATARKSSVWDVFRLLTFEWGYTPKKVEGELPQGVVVDSPMLRCDLPWVPIKLEDGLKLTVAASV